VSVAVLVGVAVLVLVGVGVTVGVFVLVGVGVIVGVLVLLQSRGGLLGGPHGTDFGVGVAVFFTGACPACEVPCPNARPANVAPMATTSTARNRMAGRLENMVSPCLGLLELWIHDSHWGGA